MDANTIALISTLALAVVGNIGAWWQLANQRKKDKEDAQTVLIGNLRDEITRLQTRGTELENSLTAKITENGDLKLAAIDKEAELRTMKYKVQDMEMRLNITSASPSDIAVQPAGEAPEVYKDILPSFAPAPQPIKVQAFPDLSKLATEIYGDIKEKIKISGDTDTELGRLKSNPIIGKLT